ncbi:MAG: AAA family ATPase [Anaerolineae bacterium]
MIGKRFVIVGATGTGKTTLAQQLAAKLHVRHIELDALHWEPNWQEAPTDVFIARLQDALSGETWIVDGNYSKARHVVWTRADTLIWLDYPLRVSLWRLFRRSLWRVFSRAELWNGNYETFRAQFLSRDSLFVWAWRFHKVRRAEYPILFKLPDYAHLKVIRLQSPKETENWLRSI